MLMSFILNQLILIASIKQLRFFHIRMLLLYYSQFQMFIAHFILRMMQSSKQIQLHKQFKFYLFDHIELTHEQHEQNEFDLDSE